MKHLGSDMPEVRVKLSVNNSAGSTRTSCPHEHLPALVKFICACVIAPKDSTATLGTIKSPLVFCTS